MADKKDKKSDNIEREYVIPLRPKFQHVARYKKTPKAVKTIKEFLVKHMKVYDRDLNKIKLDKYVNELLWIDGIKNPPHKIKVKAVKEGDIVRVEAIDLPGKLDFKKKREEKLAETSKDIAKKKKEAKKTLENAAKKETENKEDSAEEKKEEKEKVKSGEEAMKQIEKSQAKAIKQTSGGKTKAPKRPQRKSLAK
jgi:large subunit ribosomal protein L31e